MHRNPATKQLARKLGTNANSLSSGALDVLTALELNLSAPIGCSSCDLSFL